jgi:Rieske Fe-S protein
MKMRKLVLIITRYFVLAGFIFLNTVSCDKEQNSVIPYVPVSFTINLNILNDLTVPGNSVFFPGVGFGGVIVYCELQGSYYAFDATCTNEIRQNCKVKNDGILGTCECCGSKFILLGGGYPSQGPATAPLKNYRVAFLDNYTLRVYN